MESNLVLPAKLEKSLENGKGKISGISPWGNEFASTLGMKGASTKRGKWSVYYSMYKQHAIVRAAIEKIAKTATNVGFDFVPRDSRSVIKDDELTILQDFFMNQDDFMGELRKIYKDLMIYGDAFMYVVPNRARQPYRLKRLPPRTIHIRAQKNGDILGYYQKDPQDPNDDVVSFEPHEMLHFKIDDPDNSLYGLSYLESLQLAVTADLFAQRYNAAFFMNNGVTGTVIGIKSANSQEIERNRKWLMENYTGPDAAHKPLVVQGDGITVSRAVTTHQEMGFLDGRRFIILEILAVLDVPPAKIGIMESANRSNSKEQDKTFRTESVSPLQYIVESVINDQFIRKILGVMNTKFVHAEGDTRDAIEQMAYYTKGQAWGIFNANEVRGKLGMAPVDGGDTNGIMTPTGFVPLDRLDLYFQLPSVNSDKVPSVSRDPKTEAPPKRKKTIGGGEGRDIVKSVENIRKSLDQGLLKGYVALNDARELNNPYIEDAFEAVEKAYYAETDLLKTAYLSIVSESLDRLVKQEQLGRSDDE